MEHLLNLFTGVTTQHPATSISPHQIQEPFLRFIIDCNSKLLQHFKANVYSQKETLVLNCNTVQSGLFTYVKLSLSISFLSLYMTAASRCEVNINNWNNYYNYCNHIPNIPLKINKAFVFNDV